MNLTLKQVSQAGDVSSTELNTIDFQSTFFFLPTNKPQTQ
jgi:hypothetical protein